MKISSFEDLVRFYNLDLHSVALFVTAAFSDIFGSAKWGRSVDIPKECFYLDEKYSASIRSQTELLEATMHIEKLLETGYQWELSHQQSVIEGLVGSLLERRSHTNSNDSDAVLFPFETLGLGLSCTRSELKSRHRNLVKEHHPDKAGSDSEETFRCIDIAYKQILKIMNSPKQSKAATLSDLLSNTVLGQQAVEELFRDSATAELAKHTETQTWRLLVDLLNAAKIASQYYTPLLVDLHNRCRTNKLPQLRLELAKVTNLNEQQERDLRDHMRLSVESLIRALEPGLGTETSELIAGLFQTHDVEAYLVNRTLADFGY